jgi:hypothetical protein
MNYSVVLNNRASFLSLLGLRGSWLLCEHKPWRADALIRKMDGTMDTCLSNGAQRYPSRPGTRAAVT